MRARKLSKSFHFTGLTPNVMTIGRCVWTKLIAQMPKQNLSTVNNWQSVLEVKWQDRSSTKSHAVIAVVNLCTRRVGLA